MNLRDHDEDEAGKKVWLSQTEVQQLIDVASDTEHRSASSSGRVAASGRQRSLMSLRRTSLVQMLGRCSGFR